jgi:hypothetical protein
MAAQKDKTEEVMVNWLSWLLAAVLAFSIAVPLAAGALLRYVF